MKFLRRKERWPIALDIGSNSIKVLQFDEANGGLVARACGQWQFPAIAGDPEQRSEMVVDAISEILRRGDFRGRRSVSSLSCSEMDIKNVRLARTSKSEMEKALQWEAQDRFAVERLPSVFEVAARDVQLAVTLPPGFVVDDFTGEEIGNTPSEVEPQHLAPNDQMLYDLDLIDCSPDLASPELAFTFTVEWVHPVTGTDHLEVLTMSVEEMLATDHRELTKASALVAFAQAFESLAGVSDAYAKGDLLDDVVAQVDQAMNAFPADPDLPEIDAQLNVWRSMYP